MVQLLFSSFVSYISHRERFAVFAGKLAISFTNWNTSLKSKGFESGKKILFSKLHSFKVKWKSNERFFQMSKCHIQAFHSYETEMGGTFFLQSHLFVVFGIQFFVLLFYHCCVVMLHCIFWLSMHVIKEKKCKVGTTLKEKILDSTRFFLTLPSFVKEL